MNLMRFFLLAALLSVPGRPAAAQTASPVPNTLAIPGSPPPRVLPRRDSIILIVCRGLGYGDLSCYGQTNWQTPNLDRLAAEGIRFTSYYAGSGEGSSARAVLLTGQRFIQPPATPDADLPLTAGEITVAQRLRESGYHTGYIGEWGLGEAPWEKGFDEFAGCLHTAEGRDYYPPSLRRFSAGLIHDRTNHVQRDFNSQTELHPNLAGQKGEFLPELQATMAVNFLRNNQPDQFNRFKPFFLVVAFSLPRSASASADDYPVPTDAPFSGEAWPAAAKNRAALINSLDTGIGRLLEKLAKPALSNTVAVFFTSDAGPEAFHSPAMNFLRPTGPFRGHRGELTEGALRVPMMVRWPGHIPAGQVSDLPWAAWDFAPTALDLALLPTPAEVNGASVLPALAGQTMTNFDDVLEWTLPGAEPVWAARLGRWKVMQTGTNAPETFDLTVDPQERTNTANAEIIAQLVPPH